MTKPLASLSLDLDNKWAYLRTHGYESWRECPTYLPQVVPRVNEFLHRYALTATVFVVGRDLQEQENRDAVSDFAAAGHELANHSYWHYPWLDQLPLAELEAEVVDAEVAIEGLTGERPRGFRAPGFSGSPALLELLARRGYRYDASRLPTLIGPLAAMYARLKSKGTHAPQRFATLASGFAPLGPQEVVTAGGTIVELPVTTMPLVRLPFHATYILYLAQHSIRAARMYLRAAIRLCRMRGVAPSLLLHPLDFLGGEEVPELGFFPGMKLSCTTKIALLDAMVEQVGQYYTLTTLANHVAEVVPCPVNAAGTATSAAR